MDIEKVDLCKAKIPEDLYNESSTIIYFLLAVVIFLIFTITAAILADKDHIDNCRKTMINWSKANDDKVNVLYLYNKETVTGLSHRQVYNCIIIEGMKDKKRYTITTDKCPLPGETWGIDIIGHKDIKLTERK